MHLLQKNRTFIYTWPDHELNSDQITRWHNFLQRRVNGEPVAYITKEREFWGLMLSTSPETLIPRPDTEVIIEWIIEHFQRSKCRVLDLGTGTGAIALSVASENPDWSVEGGDISAESVDLAKKNAVRNNVENCNFRVSNWYSKFESERFDLIISNPPYIDYNDPHLNQGDVRFEPRRALVADQAGYADLFHIINTGPDFLTEHGCLIVEHGFQQADKVIDCFKKRGYVSCQTLNDLGGNPRATLGFFSGEMD